MNLIKKSTASLSLFITLMVMLGACKTQKSITPEGYKNDIIGIKGIKCIEKVAPQAIDSRVGILECNGISINYDYGKYSNPGPLTPEEDFTRAFDSYHHVKFFENRMIDPKVYKIFLDSVTVVDVRRKTDNDKLLFPCDPCNAVAQLTFLGETYYYPLTMSDDQLNMKGYSCSFEERDGFVYKYYQFENGLSGLYAAPKKNRYKSKNTLSLIVENDTLPQAEIDSFLRKIYLIQN